MNVIKRSGNLEPLDLSKIDKVVTWACEGFDDVSVSEIILKAHLHLHDKVTTESIHELLIKSAADLITKDTPNYQYVAAKLAIFHLRKKVYGDFNLPDLATHVKHVVSLGKYDEELITHFSDEEFAELNEVIQHNRDYSFTYAAIQQWLGKYLVKNRVTDVVYETPQFAYMAMAMATFSREVENRMYWIKQMYEELSLFRISLPTPFMAGVRTPTRQFSSCTTIDCGDSLDSINSASASIVKYVSQRAGIGINVGNIRALGSAIRGGEAMHTGVVPFLKLFQASVKSCSQGGVRGGAATANLPLWHLEIENLLVLKNNRGTEETRVRQLDYVIQLNKLMYSRLVSGGNITLFSPSDVPGLYEAFFRDQEQFHALYLEYENRKDIRKKTVKAIDLFTILMQERAQTGRIYIMNVDHANEHSAFIQQIDPVKMTNLCVEITLPTTPLESCMDEEGEIALCTLGAFNLGVFKDFKDPEEVSKLQTAANVLVRALDNILDYQDYPVMQAEKAKLRRSLGVGITNYAYWLAKHGLYYSNGSANNATHRLMEAVQFTLLTASNQLAKEKGACGYFNRTKYHQGILPIDTYHKNVDTLHSQELLLDWETLRANLVSHGLRNSTLTALMPCETSSQITNSTNGIEPPRGLVSVKSSKTGTYKQVVPDIGAVNYELLWDIPDNTGYIELIAIMQKFIDQSISANTNYDPTRFTDDKVPVQTLLKDLLTAYKLGVKTLYYHNTRDGSGDANLSNDDDGCAGGACKL